jgi:serine protease Do
MIFLLLLAAAAWAQETPAPPVAPAPPAAPAVKPAPKLKTRASNERPRPPKPPQPPHVMMFQGGGAYLGVDIDDVTADRLAALKLKEERGVEVTMVDQDAPAAKAGIKPHDVILSFNGARVEGVEQLRRMIRETPPGRNVALGLSRGGQPVNVNVQLADRRKVKEHGFKFEMPAIPDIDIPQFTVLQTLSRSGMAVENLTPQLGDFFGVKNGQGVLVRSVERGSPAEAAGLKAGDVIVRLGSETIADMGDWRRAMRNLRNGGTLQVGIVRDKREQTLSLTMPQRKGQEQSVLDFEVPEVEVPEIHIDMERMNRQIQRMQPKIQRAVKLAQADFQKQLDRELEQAQNHVERELEHAQRELDRALKEMEKELEKN